MVTRFASLKDDAGLETPVGERLMIGRARAAQISIKSSAVTNHHVVLVRLFSGEVEAQDLDSTNGTRLNGEPLDWAVLAHGDVLELAGRSWRFHLGPAVDAPLDPAESELASRLVDEAAHQVWADALLERGHPLGTRLAAGRRLPLPPVVEEAVETGAVDLTWRGGFVHEARLRTQRSVFRVREVLFSLLRGEAGRFLRTLAVPEWHPRFGLEHAPLPALQHLRVGPFFHAQDGARSAEVLERVRFLKAPLLNPPELEQYTRAWLDFGGGHRRELDAREQASFPSCAVRWEPGGWLVAPYRPVPSRRTVNVGGRERFATFLVPGDEVRSGATAFVFHAR